MAEKTTNYKMFRYYNSNRDVNQGHLKKIAKSIAIHPELLPTRPILVDKKFNIIDGQHRFEACKQLKLPVYYEVFEEGKDENAITLNIDSRPWTLDDYAKFYATKGNKHYKKFLEAMENYPKLGASVIHSFMSATVMGGNASKRFKNGGFVSIEKEEYEPLLDAFDEIIDLLDSGMSKRRAALDAWRKVLKAPNYDHKRMLAKLNDAPIDTMYNPSGSTKDILRDIEDIYNYRFHEGVGETRLF